MAIICGVVMDIIDAYGDPAEPDPITMTLGDYPDSINFVQNDLPNSPLDIIGFNKEMTAVIGEDSIELLQDELVRG